MWNLFYKYLKYLKLCILSLFNSNIPYRYYLMCFNLYEYFNKV